MTPKIPALLKKFKGKELQLLRKVRTKYGGARQEGGGGEDEGEEVTTTTCDGCGGDCSARSWFVEETDEDYCDACHSEKGKGDILQLNGLTVNNTEEGGSRCGTRESKAVNQQANQSAAEEEAGER
jgi:hypothetical protein